MQLNINTTELVSLTNKLEKLRKSALPAAVMGTLNDAAFNLKTVTMPNSAVSTFVNRQKNFFRANSTYIKAKGFDISRMKSEVGFKSLSGDNYAVEDLEQQEHGGDINKKNFIPTDKARKGGTNKGLVKPNARLKNINKIINVKDSLGKNEKTKFIKAAYVAGKFGYVLRGHVLFRIDSIVRKSKFKATPVYTFKKGRKAHVHETNFMEKATIKTSKYLDDYYVKRGEQQLNKIWK